MTGYDPGTPGSSSGPPPGWYNDPGGAPALRRWDGARWTEHTQQAPQPQPVPQPHPARAAVAASAPAPASTPKRKRQGWRKIAGIAATVIVGLIIASIIDNALSHTSSGGSSGACTTASCIITEAKQSLVGGVAKDDAVMTSLSCQPSTLKNPDPPWPAC